MENPLEDCKAVIGLLIAENAKPSKKSSRIFIRYRKSCTQSKSSGLIVLKASEQVWAMNPEVFMMSYYSKCSNTKLNPL